MIPLFLTIENFRNHSYSEIDFTSFQSALVVGKNKYDDLISNGVGKSTIFHAVLFALYNKIPASKLSKVVKKGQPKCEVTFIFELPRGIFKIQRIRSRKSDKGDLFLFQKQGEDWIPYGQKTASESEKELLSLIKIPYQAFINSVYFSQINVSGNTSAGLATSEGNDRAKILKEALELSIYSAYEKTTKEKITELNKVIEDLKSQILTIGKPAEDIKVLQSKLAEIKDTLVLQESERTKIVQELESKKIHFHDLNQQIKAESGEIFSKLFELRSQKSSLDSSLKTTSSRISEKKSDLSSKSVLLLSKSTLLSQTSTRLSELESNQPKSTSEDLQAQLEKLAAKEVEGRTHLGVYDAELKKLSKPIPNQNVCQECLQPVSEEHINNCKKERDEKLSTLQASIKQAQGVMEKIRVKKSSLQADLKQVQEFTQTHTRLKNEISQLTQTIELNQSLQKEVQNQLTSLELDHAEKSAQLLQIQSREADLQNQANQFNTEELNKAISRTQTDIQALERNQQDKITQISSLNTHTGILQEKIANKEKDLEKLASIQSLLSIEEKNCKILKMVAYSFSSEGIPSMIIRTILDDLQIESSQILRDLRPELEMRITADSTEAFDLSYKRFGEDLDFEELSGGQMLMVDWSLKIGLSMVIQKRLGVDIRMMLFDEVDQPLDKAAVDTLADIIKKLQSKFKIMVITHNDRLKDKFSHAIQVVEEEGVGAKAQVVSQW